MNTTVGTNLRTTIFGESHAEAIGCVVEGLPAGEDIDLAELQTFLARRAPGGRLATQRKESDLPRILCGFLNGRTTGAPLAVVIGNDDQRSRDYAELADKPRPSHADLPAAVRYAGFQDVRGGGAFSGRLTAPLAAAGGIAKQILERRGIRTAAHLLSVGPASDRPMNPMGEDAAELEARLKRGLPVLDGQAEAAMTAVIEAARKAGDSVGAVVECLIEGLPCGLGGPLFEGFDGALAQALFDIPGVKGVEFGRGFNAARSRGSEMNDPWVLSDDAPGARPATNNAGGVGGGITTGAPVLVRVAMKPTPSIARPQQTVSLQSGAAAQLTVHGRHDPCIGVRAVPVVEAVAALIALDALLAPDALLPPAPAARWASPALEKRAREARERARKTHES